MIFTFALPGFVQAFDFVVIANQEVPADSLSKHDIKKIYLGKKKTWENGQPIELVTMVSGDVHESFLNTIVKKTSTQFTYYWKELLFTGRGVEPKSFSNSAGVAEYVAKTKGAIGYVAPDTSPEGVKVLEVQ